MSKTYNKKLYRSKENRVIFGVMGGFGEYFDIDPVILRVFYTAIAVFTAVLPGILAYILMAMVMPNKPEIIREKASA